MFFEPFPPTINHLQTDISMFSALYRPENARGSAPLRGIPEKGSRNGSCACRLVLLLLHTVTYKMACVLSAKPEIDDTTLRGLNGQNLRGFAQGFSMIVLVLQAFHGTIWAMLKLAATFAGLYVGVSSNWLIDPLSVGGKGKQEAIDFFLGGGHLRVWKTPKLPLHNLPSFRFVSLRL